MEPVRGAGALALLLAAAPAAHTAEPPGAALDAAGQSSIALPNPLSNSKKVK